jgi:hypothetical protein
MSVVLGYLLLLQALHWLLISDSDLSRDFFLDLVDTV